MKRNKWEYLVYIHGGLLLWALLFIGSLQLRDGGRIAATLAIGNALVLFVNIPLSVLSIVLWVKRYFRKTQGRIILALSGLNIGVGILAWCVVAALTRKFH